MFKKATVDENLAGIRWINSDLISLTQQNRNKKQRPIQRIMALNFGVLHFGWAKPTFFRYNENGNFVLI